MIHPCIWVSSSWVLINGEVQAAECFTCGEELPGARYVVSTRSGNPMYCFICHACQERRMYFNNNPP